MHKLSVSIKIAFSSNRQTTHQLTNDDWDKISILMLQLLLFYGVLFCFSLRGIYSETFIHRYNIPLAHSFKHLCMIYVFFFPHVCEHGPKGAA